MPVIRKMTSDEVNELEQGTVSARKVIVELYDSLLKDCQPNDEIEIELESDERRTTSIHRLKAAAARHVPPLRLEFKRSRDPLVLRFLVHSASVPARPAPAIPRDVDIPDLDLDETLPPADWQPGPRPSQPRYEQRGRPGQSSGARQRYSKQTAAEQPGRPDRSGRFERPPRQNRQDRQDRSERPYSSNRRARTDQGPPRPNQRPPRSDQSQARIDRRPPRPDQSLTRTDQRQPRPTNGQSHGHSSRPFRPTDMPRGSTSEDTRDRQKSRRRPR